MSATALYAVATSWVYIHIIVLIVRVAATPSFGRRDPQCRGKPAGRNDVFTYYYYYFNTLEYYIYIYIYMYVNIICIVSVFEMCVCTVRSATVAVWRTDANAKNNLAFNSNRSPPDDNEGHRGSYSYYIYIICNVREYNTSRWWV